MKQKIKKIKTLNAKKPTQWVGFLVLFNAWQFPTLTWGDPTLPSALQRFTSEFGMGSGGTAALWPPSKFGFITRFFPFGQSPVISILNKPTLSTLRLSDKTPSVLSG